MKKVLCIAVAFVLVGGLMTNVNAEVKVEQEKGVIVGDGWNLVFNEEADIWGSMHNPEADVAEVPLTLSKCDSEQKLFDINLEERGKEGVLRVAWGSQQWSADFALAQ